MSSAHATIAVVTSAINAAAIRRTDPDAVIGFPPATRRRTYAMIVPLKRRRRRMWLRELAMTGAEWAFNRAIGPAIFGVAMSSLGLITTTATAQDMMRHVDLSSPDMVSAEMTRGEV